jgi:hypothetical protein
MGAARAGTLPEGMGEGLQERADAQLAQKAAAKAARPIARGTAAKPLRVMELFQPPPKPVAMPTARQQHINAFIISADIDAPPQKLNNGIGRGKPTAAVGENPIHNGAGKTAVIGESMKRVMPYAEKIGAGVYEGFKYYDKTKAMFGKELANFIGGVDNALWLIDKMVHKYKIADLGLDVERAIRSPYYLMESVLTYLYKYKEYAEDFMKGVF